MIIELDWPPKELFDNPPKHWRVKIKPTKKYRNDCCMLAKMHKPMIRFEVKFYPPDNRKRDISNVIGACKALIDGLQDAWGIDDSKFLIHWPLRFEEVVKHGKIGIVHRETRTLLSKEYPRLLMDI